MTKPAGRQAPIDTMLDVLCTSNPFLALPACAAATFAAVQEGHLIRTGAQDAE